MTTTPFEDQFQTLRELNRAFVGLLQQRARGGASLLELPHGVEPLVRTAPVALLDVLAEFPGPLFRLDFTGSTALADLPRALGSLAEAEYHLGSAILHAVRGTARQSAYLAQVLFRLIPAEVERCRALTFEELRRLACSPGLIRCAHSERPWLWHALLSAVRPEERRQLALIALQPEVPRGWPSRRPPQCSR
jgi:hypothetical protein